METYFEKVKKEIEKYNGHELTTREAISHVMSHLDYEIESYMDFLMTPEAIFEFFHLVTV